MGRQCVKEDLPARGDSVSVFCVALPSQDQPPEHKWTFTFLDDLPELPEHEVQEPEDTDKKGKPCLILFKTRSVKTHFTMLVSVSQDTICSRHDLFNTHFTMLVPVTHPMSTSPVIEYVVPAPVVTYAAASSEIDYVAPASVVFQAAPATLIERNALCTSRHEHEQHVSELRKKNPMMRCNFYFFFLPFPVFFFSKLPDPRIISNFQNYHYRP